MIGHICNTIYQTIIVNPLWKLYFYGPSVMQVGFWGGKHPSEICQTVTTYSEVFWRDNVEQCQDIIKAKFMSFRVTVEVVVYFALLYHLTKKASNLCILLFCRCRRIKEKLQSPRPRPIIYIPETSALPMQILHNVPPLRLKYGEDESIQAPDLSEYDHKRN